MPETKRRMLRRPPQGTREIEPKERPLYDVPVLAEYLGVEESTVRSWIQYRKIPFVKVGALVRFRPDTIDAWLAEREVKPI